MKTDIPARLQRVEIYEKINTMSFFDQTLFVEESFIVKGIQYLHFPLAKASLETARKPL